MKTLTISSRITDRDNDSLNRYFNDINTFPLLSVEDEVELACRKNNGDNQALEQLINCNLRFVISVAKQFLYTRVPLSELIAEGNIGLIEAAHRFDETRGFKFSSYAVWWIRQAIMRYVADYQGVVKIPVNKQGQRNQIARVVSKYELEYGQEPSNEEIAEMLDWEVEMVDKANEATCVSCSLDSPIDSESTTGLIDFLSDDNFAPDQEVNHEARQYDVRRALDFLSAREKMVLELFFGLNQQAPLTLDEISLSLQITRERVRQIKDHALAHLAQNKKAMALLRQYVA